MDADMHFPVSDLNTAPLDTLRMFASVTIGCMSPELGLNGPVAQLLLCVFPSPNHKILSSEHLENC